jgi:hypothetical protein
MLWKGEHKNGHGFRKRSVPVSRKSASIPLRRIMKASKTLSGEGW